MIISLIFKVEGKMSNVATQQELGLSNLSVADSPDTSQVLLLQSTENVAGKLILASNNIVLRRSNVCGVFSAIVRGDFVESYIVARGEETVWPWI
jgi:hypothetical protein